MLFEAISYSGLELVECPAGLCDADDWHIEVGRTARVRLAASTRVDSYTGLSTLVLLGIWSSLSVEEERFLTRRL